jgi:hypothetical protein
MLPRAGAPGPQRGIAVDAVATVIACTGTARLNGACPRGAGRVVAGLGLCGCDQHDVAIVPVRADRRADPAAASTHLMTSP